MHDPVSNIRLSRRNLLIATTVLTSITAFGGVQAQSASPVVTSKHGKLRGLTEKGISIWRGVRYAAPPTGINRWRPPQPLAAWQDIRDATSFGPACLQPVARNEPERSLKDKPQSEDCLALNIWAPQDAQSLPVMVWIHGGSFRFGTGSLDLYHGDELAKQGVIVVTLNYRLGLFGTFSHHALRDDGLTDVNFGLLDQIAALQWVRDNIAAFGGDPSNVTLFGESAGGVSVSYLMASKAARGLFHRAIVQSGGLAVPLNDRQQGDAIGRRIAEDLNLPDATAADLRALPAEALRDAAYSAADIMPQRDGHIIDRNLTDAFEAGDAGDMPLLIGWNTAEAGFFGPRYWKSIEGDLGPDRWQEFKALCVGWGRESDDAASEQIASEWFAGSVSRAMALSHRGPVHAYRFGWVPERERSTTRGAIHTAEIPYVFGHVATSAASDDASRAVSRDLSRRWAEFAKNGEPESPDGPQWRQLTSAAKTFLRVGLTGTEIGDDPTAALDEAIRSAKLPPRP